MNNILLLFTLLPIGLRFIVNYVCPFTPIILVNSPRPSDTYVSATYATISSDNGLLPIRFKAIIWPNPVLLIRSGDYA